jgi:hypothetical protein
MEKLTIDDINDIVQKFLEINTKICKKALGKWKVKVKELIEQGYSDVCGYNWYPFLQPRTVWKLDDYEYDISISEKLVPIIERTAETMQSLFPSHIIKSIFDQKSRK